MKIIHCADIHLDGRLTTHLTGDKLIKRRNEVLLAFEKMVNFASEQGVKAIVIAGDFFDSKQVSNKTKRLVFGLIKKHSDIGFYYLCGNHDENLQALTGEALPENLFVFGNEVKSFELGRVVITGVEQTRKNYNEFYEEINLQKNKFNIFVLHGQINSKEFEGVDLPRLRGKNIDYLALGHLHSYQTGKLDARGTYAYSGTLEGTGFDDLGQKGFVLLTLGEHGFTQEFVPNSIRQMHEVELTLNSNMTLLQQKSALEKALAVAQGSDLVRVRVVGKISPETHVDVNYLRAQFENDYYYFEVSNNTKLEINPLLYKDDVSLKGEFISLVLADKTLSNERKNEILSLGVLAIMGEEV